MLVASRRIFRRHRGQRSSSQEYDDGKMDGFIVANQGSGTARPHPVSDSMSRVRAMSYYDDSDILFCYSRLEGVRERHAGLRAAGLDVVHLPRRSPAHDRRLLRRRRRGDAACRDLRRSAPRRRGLQPGRRAPPDLAAAWPAVRRQDDRRAHEEPGLVVVGAVPHLRRAGRPLGSRAAAPVCPPGDAAPILSAGEPPGGFDRYGIRVRGNRRASLREMPGVDPAKEQARPRAR